MQRRTLTPRQLALIIAAFFVLLGLGARFLAREPHRVYSLGSFILAAMWLALALVSKDSTSRR